MMNNKSFENTLKDRNTNIQSKKINIQNKYCIFSSIKKDVLFLKDKELCPIFVAGLVLDHDNDVFGLRKNELIGYNSTRQELQIIQSPNLVFKVDEKNKKLLLILPYASYVMKLIREIKPILGENILIIDINLVTILLSKILKLSGVNVYILRVKKESGKFQNDLNNDINIIDIENIKNSYIKEIIFNKTIFQLNTDPRSYGLIHNRLMLNSNFLSEFDPYEELNSKLETKYKTRPIPQYDKGFCDPDYRNGINYPFSYVRWDYKRNLDYFINLLNENKINLDFINVNVINVNSMDELKEKIDNFPDNEIALFEFQ